MADRIAVMRSGLIEQVATPHGIFAKPANLFVAGFIGTPQMNLIAAELEGFGDDGRARFAIEGGQRLALVVDPACARPAGRRQGDAGHPPAQSRGGPRIRSMTGFPPWSTSSSPWGPRPWPT